MIPSRRPRRLYCKMVDHFLRSPGDWRFLGTHWGVERILPSGECPVVHLDHEAALMHQRVEMVAELAPSFLELLGE